MRVLVLTLINWIIICGFVVVCAVIGEKVEYKRERPNYKRLNCYKHLIQLGVYFLEVMFVCGILLIIAQWRSPVSITNIGSFWNEQFSRFVNMYAVYQIFIFVVLNIVQSAKIDMWLSLQTLAKYGILYLKSDADEETLTVFLKYLEQIRDPGCFVNEKGIEVASMIEDFVESGNLEALELLEVQLETAKEHDGLFWHFSFLLHLVK